MIRAAAIALLLSFAPALAGCGQKGPLKLPGAPAPQVPQAPATPPSSP